VSIPTTAPTALTRPDGSPVRALVVDDEPSLGELIQMALRYEGWQVETATDGASALAKARGFRPDVVVLDIMMPGLDGLEVLRRLRAQGDDVAVLFLTAKDAVADRVVGLTAGGDDYVTKPFSLSASRRSSPGCARSCAAADARSTGTPTPCCASAT